MFADTLPIVINAVTTTIPKVEQNGSASRFSDPTGNLVTRISHTRDKSQKKSMLRIEQRKTAADPLLAERSVITSQSVHVVLTAPVNGLFSATEQKYLLDALADLIKASAGANATKFVGGES